MADRNVDLRDKASARAMRRGAAALKGLIETLGVEQQRHFEQSAWEGDDYDRGVDPVDWVILSGLVEGSLYRNFIDADAARRQGFLRSLTHLLSFLPDGVPVWENWDPIGMTEPAFAARVAAEHLTRAAAA